MNDLIKIHGDVIKKYEISYAVLKTIPTAKGPVIQGVDYLEQLTNEGFEPFAVTTFVEAPDTSRKILGNPGQPVFCEKIWLRLPVLCKDDRPDKSPIIG